MAVMGTEETGIYPETHTSGTTVFKSVVVCMPDDALGARTVRPVAAHWSTYPSGRGSQPAPACPPGAACEGWDYQCWCIQPE
jgi:hypothetical protein